MEEKQAELVSEEDIAQRDEEKVIIGPPGDEEVMRIHADGSRSYPGSGKILSSEPDIMPTAAEVALARTDTVRTDIAVPQGSREMDSLLQMAVSKDLDIEKLERIITLKNAEEARYCKQEFDRNFAIMQGEFEPAQRSKTAEKDGKVMYLYAPLEALQSLYGPIIAWHGFSYKWREEALENGGKRVRMIISGYGYADENTFFDVPKLDKNSWQNAAQALGSMSSYGKRYTFMSGFGLVVEDQDDDGITLTFEDGVEYAGFITQLREQTVPEDLVTLWKSYYKQLNNDGRQVVGEVYKKCKETLLKKEGNRGYHSTRSLNAR